MGPRAESFLLYFRVAVVFLNNLVSAHVLVGSSCNRGRVIHML